MIVLSHFTIAPLLEARKAGSNSAPVSTDLGRTLSTVALDHSGVVFPDGQRVPWEMISEIADTETTCFRVDDGRAERIQIFSEEFQRFYSLYPTPGAPTMMAAGFPMHRIKGTDPHRDTLSKVKAIAPVIGEVLDTCTGLGYTAIEIAKTASKVTSIELDPAVREICRRNPWSRELFDHPRIVLRLGSVFDVVREFRDESFSRIMHDPPTIQLAGDLYSGEFYRELFRVLTRGGRIFHYIGDLNSAHGRSVATGALRRLQESGFTILTRRPEAFGLLAAR